MRRFRLTGPEVLIGGVQFSRLAGTILVREGQIAVVADDDPRCEDLARSPFLEEVTDEAPATNSDDGSDVKATRGKKAPAESDGV